MSYQPAPAKVPVFYVKASLEYGVGNTCSRNSVVARYCQPLTRAREIEKELTCVDIFMVVKVRL